MKKTLLILIAVFLLVPVVLYIAAPKVLVGLFTDMARASAGLSRNSVVAGDHEIFYLEGGEGETVLLLHGFSCEKDNWNRFAKYLTPSYHVVAIDLPGFGESTRIKDGAYTIAAQVERLDKIVQALSLKSFHLTGNSMGGNIAGKYAMRFPDKVLTLGLINTGGVLHCPEKSDIAALLEKGENPLFIDTEEDFDAMLAFSFVNLPWFPGVIKKVMAEDWAKNRSFNEMVTEQLFAEADDLEPDLAKIRARTLILWGDSDRLLDPSCAKVLEKGLADSSTVIMKDCGHIPLMERPEETAQHYLAFLKGR